jgi:hypothetical protein
MEPNILAINYPNGHMIVQMDEFFPTTKGKLKKLLQIVEKDWDNRDFLYDHCLAYLRNKLSEQDEENTLRSLANEAVTVRTKYSENESIVQNQIDRVNRIKAVVDTIANPIYKKEQKALLKKEKEILKDLKEKQKDRDWHFKYYNKKFNEVQSLCKKLKEEIELIEEMK